MEQAQRAPRNGGQVKRIVGKIVLQFVIATSHHLQIPHVLMLASNLILQINSTEFCGLNSNHGQYAIIQMPKNRICSTAYVVNDQSATCFPVIKTKDITAYLNANMATKGRYGTASKHDDCNQARKTLWDKRI